MCKFKFLSVLAIMLALSFGALSARAEENNWIKVSKSGHGPAVMLIPGLSSSATVWDQTAKHLKNRYRVYQVQIKGFAGEMAAPDMDEDGLLDGLTVALANYIKDNRLHHPIVIGHSMGGYLALRLEHDYGDLIGKAVIVDALPFYSTIINPAATAENMKPMAANYKAQLKSIANMAPETRQPLQRQMLTPLVTAAHDLDTITKWGLDSDANVVSQAVYELMTSDLRGDLTVMHTPTLVLTAWAEGGPYSKEQTLGFWKGQYADHKAAKVKLVEPSRHFIMLDQPDAFLAAIDGYLSQ